MSKKFKMALHFLGTGDAFSRHPNNAYFRPDEDTLVFIDLDARNFMRAKREIERKIPRRIFVLITHMHNDHVSGIPTLAEWLRYKCPDYSDSLYICLSIILVIIFLVLAFTWSCLLEKFNLLILVTPSTNFATSGLN